MMCGSQCFCGLSNPPRTSKNRVSVPGSGVRVFRRPPDKEAATAPSSRVMKPEHEEETVTEDNMDRLAWLRKVIAEGDADLMREMLEGVRRGAHGRRG